MNGPSWRVIAQMLYRFYHAIRDIVRANCTSGPSPATHVSIDTSNAARKLLSAYLLVISCLRSFCFIFGIYEDISFEVAYPYVILISSSYRLATIISWARHLRLIRHYIISILEPSMMSFWLIVSIFVFLAQTIQ